MRYADEILSYDDSYFEEIHPNVWLMDDHRWAYYIWEKSLQKSTKKRRALVHIDYHWDGINDFLSVTDQSMLKGIRDINEVHRIVSERIHVKKDSFIAPAIIRGFIEEVHFLCYQNGTTPGIGQDLLDQYGSKQFFHSDINSLLKHVPQGSFFDIDLDVFNRSGYFEEGDLWKDNEISDFLEGCRQILKSSPVITIAMSFGYSGTEEHTIFLTKFVVPKILDLIREK